MTIWETYTTEEKTRLTNLQLANEDKAAKQSIAKYLNNVNMSPSASPREKEFVFDYTEYLSDYIKWTEEQYEKVKKKPYWLTIAHLLGAERCAAIVVKALLDSCLSSRLIQASDGIKYDNYNLGDLRSQTKQNILGVISRELWLAIGIRLAKENYSEEFARQSHYFKNWNKKRMKAFARKCQTLPTWDNQKRNVVALSFYTLMVGNKESVMPFVENPITIVKNGQIKRHTIISLREEFTKNFEAFHNFYQYYKWLYYPMVCPPIPHDYPNRTAEDWGGSLHLEYRKSSVHNTRAGNYYKNNSEHSQQSINALNALQGTEWSINKRVLEVMTNLYKSNRQVCNLPPYEHDEFVFSKPFPEGEEKEVIAKWKNERAEAWGLWEKTKQKRMQMEMRLLIADDLKDLTFWHAYSSDFRGRCYTQSSFLSPQSGDFDCGIIQFAEGVKLEANEVKEECDYFWLKVHLANRWDFDKASFEERAQWVDDNIDMLRQVYEDPEGTVDLWKDDKAKKNVSFRRLADTIDFFVALETGYSYVPKNLDGTCNGIQHWVGTTKAENLAELVNVIKTLKPGDMYKFIAHNATAKMEAERDANQYFDMFLTHWEHTEKDKKMPRGLPKRTVMCDPYGVTFYSARQYIRSEGHLDWCRPLLEERGLSWQGAIMECTSVIWEALQEALILPNEAKEYIKDCVEVCYNSDDRKKKPLQWTTPSGFKVRQYYTEHIEYITDIALLLKNDVRIRSTAEMWQFTDNMDVRKMATAIPPNWVHSIDAAHMVFVVLALLSMGCRNFCMIHDSFGVPVTYLKYLPRISRETFYEIHKESQLELFKQDLENFSGHELPNIPEQGSLIPEEILESEYLFC
jgi:DNA-directed RNA polymerase